MAGSMYFPVFLLRLDVHAGRNQPFRYFPIKQILAIVQVVAMEYPLDYHPTVGTISGHNARSSRDGMVH